MNDAGRAFLSRFAYDGKDDVVGSPDPLIVRSGIDAVGGRAGVPGLHHQPLVCIR